jgi:signal transduction histidine kinase
LSVQATGQDAIIHVVDDGLGFSDSALVHLFEAGFSTHKADSQRAGMGLYIARRLMQSIGGDIGVCNRPEGGADVSLIVKNLQ